MKEIFLEWGKCVIMHCMNQRPIVPMGKSLKVPLVASAVAKEIFHMASCLGFGKEDDAAIVKVIEKIAGFEVKRLKK